MSAWHHWGHQGHWGEGSQGLSHPSRAESGFGLGYGKSWPQVPRELGTLDLPGRAAFWEGQSGGLVMYLEGQAVVGAN